MSNHRVVEKRGRFYPEYYTPERTRPFLFIFVLHNEAEWKPFTDEEGCIKCFSNKEQAILWIKTGSPYHPDKTVWED